MPIFTDQIQSEDVNPEEVKKYIVFHDELNPKIWTKHNKLIPMVRLKLLKAGIDFYKFLDIKGLRVEDITLTGSNASFNYTPLSDLDIHLIVNFNSTPCPAWADNLFTTKKALWNKVHSVTVNGYGVELYVQDRSGLLEANGVYSIMNNRWIVSPRPERPSWDDMAVVAKTDYLVDEIDAILASDATADEIQTMRDKLRNMRRAGLSNGGEFATENLAYKSLRNLGYLDRLYQARLDAEDRSLSL